MEQDLMEAKKLLQEVDESPLLRGRNRPYPHIPGGFAKKGFRADIDSVCALVEKAAAKGAGRLELDTVAKWLEEIIPHYLNKHKLKGSGGAVMVSLKRGELVQALKRKIREVCQMEV